MQLINRAHWPRIAGGTMLLTLLMIMGCQTAPTMTGVWEVDKERSTHLGPWRNIELRITASDSQFALGRLLNPRHRDQRHDSVTVPVNGTPIELPVTPSAKWLEQPHLGVFLDGTAPQQLKAVWESPGRVLNLQHMMTLQTSQSETTVEILRTFSLSDDGQELTVVESRSSRPGELTYVYTRK
jgi:hypothetical protein